eukprot:ctg_1555.g548
MVGAALAGLDDHDAGQGAETLGAQHGLGVRIDLDDLGVHGADLGHKVHAALALLLLQFEGDASHRPALDTAHKVRHKAGDLVAQSFRRDERHLIAHPFVGVKVAGRQARVVLFDDDAGGLFDGLGPHAAHDEWGKGTRAQGASRRSGKEASPKRGGMGRREWIWDNLGWRLRRRFTQDETSTVSDAGTLTSPARAVSGSTEESCRHKNVPPLMKPACSAEKSRRAVEANKTLTRTKQERSSAQSTDKAPHTRRPVSFLSYAQLASLSLPFSLGHVSAATLFSAARDSILFPSSKSQTRHSPRASRPLFLDLALSSLQRHLLSAHINSRNDYEAHFLRVVPPRRLSCPGGAGHSSRSSGDGHDGHHGDRPDAHTLAGLRRRLRQRRADVYWTVLGHAGPGAVGLVERRGGLRQRRGGPGGVRYRPPEQHRQQLQLATTCRALLRQRRHQQQHLVVRALPLPPAGVAECQPRCRVVAALPDGRRCSAGRSGVAIALHDIPGAVGHVGAVRVFSSHSHATAGTVRHVLRRRHPYVYAFAAADAVYRAATTQVRAGVCAGASVPHRLYMVPHRTAGTVAGHGLSGPSGTLHRVLDVAGAGHCGQRATSCPSRHRTGAGPDRRRRLVRTDLRAVWAHVAGRLAESILSLGDAADNMARFRRGLRWEQAVVHHAMFCQNPPGTAAFSRRPKCKLYALHKDASAVRRRPFRFFVGKQSRRRQMVTTQREAPIMQGHDVPHQRSALMAFHFNPGALTLSRWRGARHRRGTLPTRRSRPRTSVRACNTTAPSGDSGRSPRRDHTARHYPPWLRSASSGWHRPPCHCSVDSGSGDAAAYPAEHAAFAPGAALGARLSRVADAAAATDASGEVHGASRGADGAGGRCHRVAGVVDSRASAARPTGGHGRISTHRPG